MNNKFLIIIVLFSYVIQLQDTEGGDDGEHSHKIPFGSYRFYLFIFYSTIIVLFAGTMSGLTVGYSSIDPL